MRGDLKEGDPETVGEDYVQPVVGNQMLMYVKVGAHKDGEKKKGRE